MINLLLSSSLNLFEFKESVCLFFLRYVVVEVCGGRAGTARVLEDVKAVVLTLLDEFERLAEVVVSFAGKADDDVAGKRQTTAGALDTLDSFEIVAALVSTAHQFQDAIAA